MAVAQTNWHSPASPVSVRECTVTDAMRRHSARRRRPVATEPEAEFGCIVPGTVPWVRTPRWIMRTNRQSTFIGSAAPLLAVLLAFSMEGCGERAGPAAPPPLAQREAFPGIAAALTIDPTNLPEYAAPLLPLHLQNLGNFDNTPASNPITNAGATLGRVMFFDTQLSINGVASCAS